jgi:phosphoribosylaminoimidazole-succinocarboxamide synthase
MTDQYCQSVADRYIELYEEITGTPFQPATDADLAARIERNVTQWLASR